MTRRVLIDSCISHLVADGVRALGHDVRWTGDLPKDPGDEEVLTLAHSEARVLVTADKDFGELAIARRQRHVGIIRVVDLTIAEQTRTVAEALQRYATELEQGALVVIGPGDKVRIRLAALDS